MAAPLRIVGLGGSAGAASALRAFLGSVPADAGTAYVIVAPGAEIAAIGDQLRVPLVRITAPTALRADHAYVAAEGNELVVVDGAVQLVPERDPEHDGRVDRLFRSLAHLGKDCAAIVLSGASAEGSIGLKQVKEAGGLTIAQEPDDAEHDAAPRSAIQTGLVDVVAPAAAIPERLAAIFRAPTAPGASPSDEDALRDVLTLVRIRSGHDFTNYKRATLLRRVDRRMQVCGAATIDAYLRFVRENPGELASLLRDFLISVTHFFRDPEAWAALDQLVLRKLFAGRDRDQPVRIWAPACATGEEAYSLAILCAEHCARLDAPPPVQIFATDIDDDALSEARTGCYPDAISTDVPPERLARFFIHEDAHYRVKKEIREMVLFSSHNLLRDPPFSRLDLVSCRNLLIYFDRDAQERVLHILHFALVPDGYLFLGTSESADGALFAPTDAKQRIFTRRPATSHVGLTNLFQHPKWPAPPSPTPLADRPVSSGDLHYRLVEHYAAPSVLVDDELELVHVSERAGRYLTVGGGEPTRNLLRLVHPDLRLDLRAALYAARQPDHKDGDTRTVRVQLDGKPTMVQLTVRSFDVPGLARSMLLVLFDEHASTRPPAQPSDAPAMEPVVRQLEDELARTRDQLRMTVEQYETSVEELKASNEELHAINEELRSATEELETSKEELQSVNEELTTVNHELKDKVDEVSRTNSDLQNLMTSTEIAVVFLDRQLRIKRFTPRAQDIFNVIDTDIGRPLAHLTHRLDATDLGAIAAEVLRDLRPIERELRAKDGRHYLARVLPYRSLDDRVDGVVVTCLDVTELAEAEDQLRATERMLKLAERAAEAGIWRINPGTLRVEMSEQLRALHGLPAAEDGLRLSDLLATVHEGDRERVDHAIRKAVNDRGELDVEFRIEHPQRGVRWLWKTGRAEADGRALAGIAIDVTARRGTEAALRASEERFRLALRTAPVVMLAQDRDLRYTWGYMLGGGIDFVGKTDFDLFPPDEATRLTELKRGALETGIGRREEVKLTMGTRSHYYDFNVEPIRGEGGRLIGVSCAAVDVTPSKLAELSLRDADRRKDEFLATLAHELRNPLAPLTAALDIQKLAGGDLGRIERAREIAARQVDQLVRLVDDLLDVSRITQGKIHLRIQKATLAPIVDAALEATRGLFETARNKLEVDVPAGVELETDATRMTQVITNLLSNAAKYTPAGGHVSLRARVADGTLELAVRDDGVGLDAQMLPRAFDLFAQADGTGDRGLGGLGIGLNLVRRLVELHGGTVDARSGGRGQGSEFVVRVPMTQERSRVMEKVDERARKPPSAPRRVLVIDDNPDVIQTVAELLRMIGHEVHVAHDGPSGLAVAARERPEVVLLDLGLPGMNGYEVARKLRAMPGGGEMSLVAVTGWGQPDDVARTREAGFDHHLVKPAGLAALREILGEARR